MNPIAVVAVIALLLIIRLAIPCAVIGGLCFGMDRLYKRWDEEDADQGVAAQ
ncbi:MAG: hypothetical protein ACK2U0_13690 [Candidatus Promineifilaceae bacterium]